MGDTEKSKPEKKNSKALSRRKFTKISLTAIAATGIAIFLKRVINPVAVWGVEFTDKLVDSAFRLTDHHSLLNLEFYFINCEYKSSKIWAKYGAYENYMVVRLPQQHIAEQNFTDGVKPDVGYRAATYISNYSYLVFRILFPEESFWDKGKFTSIELTKEELLNWGNEEKLRLVVRQDLTESLFELSNTGYYNKPPDKLVKDQQKIDVEQQDLDSLIRKNAGGDTIPNQKKTVDSVQNNYSIDSAKARSDSSENFYPFQQIFSSDLNKFKNKKDSERIKDSLRINRIPKAYGDPISAIELPWRLIISPKLPDSSRFKFKWDIPSTSIEQTEKEKEANKQRHKLWMVTLSITERDDEEYKARKKSDAENNNENQQSSTGSLNTVINQLELMILGSRDYPNVNFNPTNSNGDLILPTGAHRKDLVALYIKLKVLARTEKLTLSAIGGTVKIHLKNNDIEKALKLPKPIGPIGVIEWNQIISLGRDEKVEVSTLFLEAEFGHKMAYIEIAERKLKDGIYVLIKTSYIMPLDISKDYTNHITQTTEIKDVNNKPQIISRFNAPFKKITFLETKPKVLIMGKNPDGTQKNFNQDKLNQTETNFQFEAIDWHDNLITFTKTINALPFGAVVDNNWLNSNSEIRKVIAPTDATMYDPANANVLKDSIPIVSTSSLDSTFKTIDSTSIFTAQIDGNLKALRGIYQKVDSLVSVFQAGEPITPDSLDPSQRIIQLQNYFNEFFQFIKNTVQRLIERKNQDLDFIKNGININSLKIYLINKYLIINSDIYKKVNEKYQQVKVKVSPPLAIDIFTNDIFFNDITDGQLRHFINVIQQSFTSSFLIVLQKIAKKEALSDIEKNNFFVLFYNQVLIDFPAVANAIQDLTELFGTAEITLQSIINTIQQKLSVIYEIEKTAKKIPGLILLQKQKIGYAIKETFNEEVNKAIGKSGEQLQKQIENVTGQVKKSLSELESEYIIFKGGLRQAANKAFDFFHDYAIIPQVQQAKVYVSALNKLVNEDLPISINYARDYIENQVRDAEFEVKQNAAMVFAEVQQYSREEVKGLIQKIGDKMPGLNVEIPAHFLTYARNPQAIAEAGLNAIKDTIGKEAIDKLKDYSRDLIFISEEVKNAVKVMDDLKNADPKKYFKDLGAKLFGSIGLEDILDIGFDLPRLTELPDKLIYQVSTDKFKNFQAAFVVFKPNVKAGNPTRLELFISKSLKNLQEYYAYTQLNNFSVGVIIGGTEVLTITFEQFKITSAPNQPKKTDVSITDVKVGGPLEFIADLAKRFMAPGNGMRIKPGPRNLLVDYTIALPDIKAPAFNFKNLQFVIGVNIPYDPSSLKAISFTFGVNKPEDKFLVSAGIYGGRGHFQLRATPKGIEQIDVAIELGAYASIDLGIGKGEVFLFFGFWFVTGKDDTGQNFIKAVAYVICSGSATVLGFITIGVSVLIALTYIKRGETSLFYGEAVVTYSVKIAFFKKEFSIRYYKEIAGSSKGNNTQSLQTGVILLDATAPGGVSISDDTDAKNFEDVFENEDALKEYILSFA